ncbi:hypothetical protein PVK06_009579 [Gossypium arboreum]|uniref:DUF4283 domain-containing protein n=1 Tax=Gossypium arboreum TaxID=29729 RepID=A0ABR0QMW6_GOSAR|nr:hypothetical protein PVK06_009579 [Gossypium arboreum]
MMVDPRPTPNLSWKDTLMGIGTGNIAKTAMTNSGMGDDDHLEFLEGDIDRSTVNGIPAIDFSDSIQRILFKEMETMVVLKLLGRNIDYGALSNRISSFRRPSKPFHLMDKKNRYYLAKFQCTNDFEKVISQGP